VAASPEKTRPPNRISQWPLTVHHANIDYGAWSNRRRNPHAYPPDLGGIGGSLLNGVAAQIGSIWRGRDVFRAAGIADLD
jgi:hypothetical protein